MEIKYLKSIARLLNRDYVNRRGLDLSKKVLLVCVGQRAAEQEVKKISSARPGLNQTGLHLAER